MASPTSTRSSSPATAAGWRRSPSSRAPSSRRPFTASSSRADDPDAAAAILIAQNPGVFDGNPALPKASQEFLASGGFLRDPQGAVGRQTLAEWQGYSSFLYDQGLLTGPDGKPLTAPPDYAALFTNDFLP